MTVGREDDRIIDARVRLYGTLAEPGYPAPSREMLSFSGEGDWLAFHAEALRGTFGAGIQRLHENYEDPDPDIAALSAARRRREAAGEENPEPQA